MAKDTTGRGELSELEIATALTRAGFRVLRPFSSALRYDLALDNGDGTLSRIQCKTGILRDGFIEFNVSSADGRRPNGVPYLGQIDAFGVYCPQNGGAYIIPLHDMRASASKGRLRINPAKNNQLRGVLVANVYEIQALDSSPNQPTTASTRPRSETEGSTR